MSKVTLEDIHECLIGNKLAGQKGIISTIDDLVESHDRMNDKICIIENRICNIEKYHEGQKNKISFKIPKWVSAVTGLIIKTKTGL